MAFADQYVVYGYWDTGYCVGDVTATEASASIDGVCSVVSSAIRLRLANASITSTALVNSSCIRIRDFSGSISASATITASAILNMEMRTIGLETFLPSTSLFRILCDMKYSNRNMLLLNVRKYIKHLCLKSILILLVSLKFSIFFYLFKIQLAD